MGSSGGNTNIEVPFDLPNFGLDQLVEFLFGNGSLPASLGTCGLFLMLVVETKRHGTQDDVQALGDYVVMVFYSLLWTTLLG